MGKGLYIKLAKTGIFKNRRIYVPYILAGIGMAMMFYIVTYLSTSQTLGALEGISTAQGVLDFGKYILGIFDVIFLFYTNTFLMRRRKKEFGLYNILGMNKWNIAKILVWETVHLFLLTVAGGLFFGITFSKLAELLFVNMIRKDIIYSFSISKTAVIQTVILFIGIFVLLLINSLRQVHLSDPISLMKSENVGEKPPKANYVFAILGVIILGIAYYIAVSIKNPVASVFAFMFAACMVIVATYLLFIAGSVVLCRVLQKNKGYYYNPKHYISVSSMVYRMKRNGAGLASICILITMVLVMMSPTACLFLGTEESIKGSHPREMMLEVRYESVEKMTEESLAELQEIIVKDCGEAGADISDTLDYRCVMIAGLLKDGRIETDKNKVSLSEQMSLENLVSVIVIPLSDYNRMTGETNHIDSDEALVYTSRSSYDYDKIQIADTKTYRAREVDGKFILEGNTSVNMIGSVYMIVPDFEEEVALLSTLVDYNGEKMIDPRWAYDFNINIPEDQQKELVDRLYDDLRAVRDRDGSGVISVYFDSLVDAKEDYHSTFAGFFFLGGLLSVVFIAATVLVIYYKQISEGYEDEARFEIMQKVGMTKEDIRRSINSQMLTVFALPIVGAVVHLAFAFPMIRKILMLFWMDNLQLFLATTGGCVLVFAVIYVIIYKFTSNAYYSIVSGARE